jgi:hypothetical protein
MSDQDLPMLLLRVNRVIKYRSQGIAKHRGSFFKGNFVFLFVESRFLPLEPWHIRTKEQEEFRATLYRNTGSAGRHSINKRHPIEYNLI